MKWFMKVLHKDFKLGTSFYSIGLGLSYTPLEDVDKKSWFQFRESKLIKPANWWIIKFLLLDIVIIWEHNVKQFSPSVVTKQ